MRQIVLLFVALSCAQIADAEHSLLLVKITDSQFTEYSNCTDDDCIPHNFWWIYNAVVKKTIAGRYSKDEIRFVRLQHAQYIDKIRDHLFVLIDETDDESFTELFGTNLIARDTAIPVSLVCFGADLKEIFPDVERFDYDEGVLKKETCFEQDMLENGVGVE